MTVPGRLAALRVLLLVLVAFGVLGMHTIGHHSGAEPDRYPGEGHGAHAVVASAVGHGAAGHTGTAVLRLSATDPASLTAPPVPPGNELDPAAVCLAIVTAAGITVLVAGVWLAARHAADAGRTGFAAVARHGRAPPPFGLLLTRLSVLRT